MISTCLVRATVAVAAAVTMLVPSVAWAGFYQEDVVLGFGAAYQSTDDKHRTHHGVDVRFRAGEEVAAPRSGTVRFAGRVPGALGGTVLAVSVDTDMGRITLMPLEQLAVESGQDIGEGDVVGTVAETGDPSSAGAHIHVSLKAGGMYLDPSGLLTLRSEPGAEAEEVAVQPDTPPVDQHKNAQPQPTALQPTTASEQPLAARQPNFAPETGGASRLQISPGVAYVEGAGVSVPLESGSKRPSGGMANAPQKAVTEAPCQMAEGVSLAPGGDSTASDSAASRPSRPLSALKTASKVLRPAATRVRQAPLGAPAYITLLVACACGALLLRMRAFESRLTAKEPVSDRLGKMLQQLRTGDTLRGLTSCPGEAAFTVPGPSSPGEVTK